MIKYDIPEIFTNFNVPGNYLFAEPFGGGHINDTFRVTTNQGGTEVRYTLQRINHYVFKNPPELMDNYLRVTEHIHRKLQHRRDSSRHGLYVIRDTQNRPYYKDSDGNFWRCYCFVEKARSYDICETPEQAYTAAKAFGEFQLLLVDLPGSRLFETIPDFHNTPKRLADLEKAIAEDPQGRVKEVQKEIDFVLSRRDDANLLVDLHKAGEIPERITHNDTKLNNVLIDFETNEGICVIDLDTIMPGLVHYDFGDMIRTSTSPAPEDETDLSKIYMQFEMFEAILRGYLDTAGKFLTPTERKYLPFSGKLITMEIGIRFLEDHIRGDVYFKTHRPNHNLDRARSQFKLVESIEEQMDKMNALLDSIN
jgi:Ser/Thr protein kinase RdoA (MazF antagonist)